ncbi:YceD family protein [Syntrophomonas palmitatica]|uniref:YceD family protein n=1 Tax=Syntrophomonas palmitatica TaxID=402877 RepID=UPI0006D28CCF|nr:DUF177 domain-containing protein [Syntrophomonas palmitatica]
MKLNLKTLKLHPRESVSFHLEEPGDNSLIKDIGACFADIIGVDIVIRDNDTVYEALGRLYTSLKLSCSRCLEDFIYNIEAEMAFDIVEEEQNQESRVIDDMLVLVKDEVDIQPLVYEIIFTEIPFIPLCQEGCRGLCPVCGQNRNQDQCSCQEKIIDPRWEKLKNYT